MTSLTSTASSIAHQALLDSILTRSYREGDFTLSSGQKSTFYIDLKPTLLHPDGAAAFGAAAVEWMKQNAHQADAVGGLTLGADPMVMAVSLAARTEGMSIPALMIRKEPKKHGTSKFIEGVENLKPGARVLVLEDVVTTGGSAKKAIEILRAEGFVPTAVLCVVDREAGGANAFAEMGVPLFSLFTISQVQREFASRQ
jgi:orotate phosphoribosyltransferase